jgi:hypothetical protein
MSRESGHESLKTHTRMSLADNNESFKSSHGPQIMSGICVLEKGIVSRTKNSERIETDELMRDQKSQREAILRSNRKVTD